MKRITLALVAALAMLAGCTSTGEIREFEVSGFRCTVTGPKLEVSGEGVKAATEGITKAGAALNLFALPPRVEGTESEEQLPIDKLIAACKDL